MRKSLKSTSFPIACVVVWFTYLKMSDTRQVSDLKYERPIYKKQGKLGLYSSFNLVGKAEQPHVLCWQSRQVTIVELSVTGSGEQAAMITVGELQ